MSVPPVVAAADGATSAARCALRHAHAPAVMATPATKAIASGSGDERPSGSRVLAVWPSPPPRRFSTAAVERARQLLHRAEAIVRVLGERAIDHLVERGRDLGAR